MGIFGLYSLYGKLRTHLDSKRKPDLEEMFVPMQKYVYLYLIFQFCIKYFDTEQYVKPFWFFNVSIVKLVVYVAAIIGLRDSKGMHETP